LRQRFLFACSVLVIATAPARADVGAHRGHHHHPTFSAGEPGNPKRPARVVQIVMREADGKMLFIPDRVEVRRGEQIKSLLRNNGELEHEFVLATTQENEKHAEEMKKNPDMVHEDPNARRLQPKKEDFIVWRFTKGGEFEYGCLIPGHRETGMIGRIVVNDARKAPANAGR
jgi:uncharacterized cupredoxin-like copper-binding protein